MLIKIGPINYEVLFKKRVRTDGGRMWGLINYGKQTIKVQSTLSPTYQRHVLWHEVIHGILHNAGYKDHDEDLIDCLSMGITGVLEDNEEMRSMGG